MLIVNSFKSKKQKQKEKKVELNEETKIGYMSTTTMTNIKTMKKKKSFHVRSDE